MSMEDNFSEADMKVMQKLEDLIRKAVKRIDGKKENDICRYLPVTTGGYMHHFTMRKMKTEQPKKLTDMINQFILSSDKPSSVSPKARAARGSRKRRDGLSFTRMELERLLEMAKRIGDREMIVKLSPKKSLAAYKRDLIASIRNNEAHERLWRDYVEALAAAKAEGDSEELVGAGNVLSSAISSSNW